MKTKLLSIALSLFPLVASAGESFFFEYAQGSKPTEKRIEGDRLHQVTPIRKIEAPKASSIVAFHSGIGPDRDYVIQVDFKTRPGERWAPMVKLGDDLITHGFYTSGGEDGSKFSYCLESSDPGKIKAWTRELGKLVGVPEDQIDIDLTMSEEDDPAKPIPLPVPQPEPKPAAQPGEIAAAEYTDKSQRTIRFKVDGADKEITAPEGKFWEDLVVCKNKKVAYFVLKRGNRGGSWIEDLHRFVAEGPEAAGTPTKIPLKTDLKEAKVIRLYDVSDDGSRLLADLHYMTKKEGESTFYDSYPYFINAADGRATPVKASQAPEKAGGKEGAVASMGSVTAEYEFFESRTKKYPLGKAFAAHLEALVKTKPTTPEPGPRPNALPIGFIRVNGKAYSYFGSLWRDDKEYWKSPQLDEFWKFLNSHPAAEIPDFEPGTVAKP